MKTTFKFQVILGLLLGLAGSAAHAGPWEELTLSSLMNRELSFYGIDADVRRLLNDADFEADLHKWWTVVTPSYVQNMVQNGQDATYPAIPEAADNRAWAQRANLQAKNDPQFKLRVLFSRHMDTAIPSEKTQIYLAYFLRTGQKEKARSLLRIYAQEYSLWAREVLEDPRFIKNANPAATELLKIVASLLDADASQYKQCQQANLGNVTAQGDCLAWSSMHPILKEFSGCVDVWKDVESTQALAKCLKEKVYFTVGATAAKPGTDILNGLKWKGPSHVVSRTGFLTGNAVRYFTRNRNDHAVVTEFEKQYAGNTDPVADAAKQNQQSVDQLFAILNQNKTPFTELPFQDTDTHPMLQYSAGFGPQQAIFPELLRAIRSARHTIFVDIFFLGGTLGHNMAKELIKKAESGVKVFLLHDPWNSFDYKKEMDPIFNMMLAYSRKNPAKMVAAGSYIFAHRTGLPSYFDAILPDALVKSLATQIQKLSPTALPLFPKAKSDHSKVMVVDGAGLWPDSFPVAYVGSKNWTDSSGGMTFDEVARVIGPAAVAVQDSYYWDMWYALTYGGPGRTPMNTQAIEAALTDFDPLLRKWDPARGRVVATRDKLVNVGANQENIRVRIGENNVDGSVMGPLDQNIALIRNAKAQIVVNDQFLYDRRIVEELIDKAKNSPEVQIYIMLEPISKSSGMDMEEMGGFPNTLYADLLTYKTLRLNDKGEATMTDADRWPNMHLKWKYIPHSEEFHLEYHMKTISVDGFNPDGSRVKGAGPAAIVSGSANKDHMTMHGAFREMQLEIWDDRPCASQDDPNANCGAVAAAEKVFWKRWDEKNPFSEEEGGGSVATNPFKFSLPDAVQNKLKPLLGRNMTSAEFLMFARSLIHTAYELESTNAVE